MTAAFEFRCFSDIDCAIALHFDVYQALSGVLYRVVDVCQFCVESFGVSIAVAMFCFFCNAKCIVFLFYLRLNICSFYLF